MSILSLLLVFLLLTLLALRWYARHKARRSPVVKWPLYAKRPLANPSQVLYQRLVVALPGHTVLNRVALGDVLGVRRGTEPARWSKRIRNLYFDFVVCTSDTTVLAVIALDDRQASASVGTQANQIKAHAAASAGVRLLHWQANALPDQATIQGIFGMVPSPSAEGMETSANQSWWPPIALSRQQPPAG